jgi:FMN phosphatase YigB (HAD superfamily)
MTDARDRLRPPPPRAFSHVETWVFDLDNTLYPHHINLWQQVDVRRPRKRAASRRTITAATARPCVA